MRQLNPKTLYCGKWDTAHYCQNIAKATAAELPALREALETESARLRPRKKLVRRLRARIAELENGGQR